MPRRRSRFSQLTKILRDGGAPEAGSRAEGYLNWLQGRRKINVINNVPETGKDRIGIALLPFGTSAGTGTAGDRYRTSITRYSLQGIDGRTQIAVTATGILQAGVRIAEDGNQVDAGYFPALFKIAVYRGTGTVESKTSGITGKEYKTREKRSFTLPFGRTTTGVTDDKTKTAVTNLDNADELEVFKSLRDIATTGVSEANTPRSISYDPELFRAARDNTKKLTDLTAAGTIDVT